MDCLLKAQLRHHLTDDTCEDGVPFSMCSLYSNEQPLYGAGSPVGRMHGSRNQGMEVGNGPVNNSL